MKRLLILLLLVCGMTTGLRAQTAQLTRDGYLVKTFTGASSLSSAISAAANKGDIIILSSGNFSNPGNITKSVSIYGQGFENSTAIGNARTYIAGKIEFKLMSEGALDGIHLEGLFIEDDLNINTNIGTTAIVDDFTVTKCHSGGVFFYLRSTNVKLQNCKFDRDVRTYPGSYTTTMQVDNCYIEGNLFNFADGSNVIVNNSLIYNNWLKNYSAATSFNNCIIYKNILNGSSATKCIFNQSSVSGSTDNCWMGVNNGDIYVSEGEDGSYGESKSFAVKDTYVGTDNTPVGLQGGIGWNKTPTIPSYLTPEDLPQDAEGYYLLDGKMAWLVFAALVNGGTYDAKAKMTADIDLGNDQTMIGDTGESTSSPCFSGIFDGQGYTLTVAYTGIGSSSVGAPFAKINGATIKNLHVKGSLSSAGYHPTSIVSDSWGTSRLEKVWGEVDITGTRTGWVEASGLVGCMKAGNLTIEDCLFTGTVNGSGSYNGCFIGYIDSGSATITNSLSTGTFSYSGGSNGFRGTHTNCYVKQFPTSYPSGVTKPTDEELADGTTTTALNNGRSEVIWVQDAVTNMPMLAIFANAVMLGDVNGDHNIDENDLDVIVKIVMGEMPSGIQELLASDLNNDGKVDAADVVKMVDILNSAGALSGKFTINSSGDKVRFSEGNLQAKTTDKGTHWTWGFATNQWDYIGKAAANTKINGNGMLSTTNGTVDLFGWVGASSSWTDDVQYGISNSTTNSDYGTSTSDALKSDWGNSIGSGWRTLTIAEWSYLFNTRSGATVNGTSNARYARATINTDVKIVEGVILFPDGVTIADSEVTWGTINGTGTRCTSKQWTALEAKGCVFLPAAGYRWGKEVYCAEGLGSYGNGFFYWSSSPYTSDVNNAQAVYFFNNNDALRRYQNYRSYGGSVRLVRDVVE